MTHEYRILAGGTVIPGGTQPDCTAIAWADGTVLALGGDDAVLAISRGDSHVADLAGAVVVPLGADGTARWPAGAVLEIGGPADLAVLDEDPRRVPLEASPTFPGGIGIHVLARVRGGRLVEGALPGLEHGDGTSEAPPPSTA